MIMIRYVLSDNDMKLQLSPVNSLQMKSTDPMDPMDPRDITTERRRAGEVATSTPSDFQVQFAESQLPESLDIWMDIQVTLPNCTVFLRIV